MIKKRAFKIREIFSFLEVGGLYWRLLILPFIGAFISFLIFEVEVSLFVNNFLSSTAIFNTIFLFVLLWIGSSIRDKLFARNVINLILLWPISKRQKMFYLYLRSTWLPGVLLLLGAISVLLFIHSDALGMLIASLPYLLAVGFFIGVINWKGSYIVTDAGSFVGKISVREETSFYFIFFICLSPIVFDYLPFILEFIATVFLIILGFVYGKSTGHEIQNRGITDNNVKSYREDKTQDLNFFESIKSTFWRYYYYLEWNTIKSPLQMILLNVFTSLFISTLYYALLGMFSSDIDITYFQRVLYISFFASFSTIMMNNLELLFYGKEKVDMLLPLSYEKKAVVSSLHRIFLPSVYTFFNAAVVSLIINLFHRGLAVITPQPHLAFGSLVFDTLFYTLSFLPLSIAAYSLMEFLLTAVIIILEALRFMKLSSSLYRGTFLFYLIPLGFLWTFIGEKIITLESFLGYQAIAIYIGVFLLSRIGLYWGKRRVQVIF
ncbi:MAG: hypothetical protein ACLFUI_01075 [Halanaerobiales bacterium]